MPKRRCGDRAQLKLQFDNPMPQPPVGREVKGLVEALADLLMAAAGQRLPGTQTDEGGADEQDHA